MTTSFAPIYKSFLNQIDDWELALVEDENEQEEILFLYLLEAVNLHFTECKTDLTIIEETNEFQSDLSGTEQQILALGMKKAWMSSQLYNGDLMRKDIGDRDYKAVQGFDYVKQLRALDEQLSDEIRKYAVRYTYKKMKSEDW